MATPPRIDPASVTAAVNSIRARHRDRDDRYLDEMGETPSEVLSYLRKHAPDFPEGVRCDDLDDVDDLLLACLWETKERERFWLRQVVKLSGDRAGFARTFGITSRQGFKDWLDRLHALLDETGPGRPDEQATRADRRSAVAAANAVDGEQAWSERHLQDYLAIAHDVVALYMDVDEETASFLQDVRRDLRTPEDYGPGQVVALGWAMEALEECEVPQVRERIKKLVDRWADLQQRRKEASAGW